MRLALVLLAVGVGACAVLRPAAPTREALGSEYRMSPAEVSSCEVAVDMVRSARASLGMSAKTRADADADLQACVLYVRTRGRPREPGEPPRDAHEKLADEIAAKKHAERTTIARLPELRAATPPEVRRRASSAALCRYATWRTRLMAHVAREHRYAGETGVQNLALLQALKVQLEAVDDGAEQLRAAFAAKQIEPERCSVPAVASLQRCVWLQAGGGLQPLWNMPRDEGVDCDAADVRPYLAYLGQ